MKPKTVPRLVPAKLIPRHCEAENCAQATRLGKPYCSQHVALHPYVRELLAQLEAQENELAKVRRMGARAVRSDGLTAQEIIAYLRAHGRRTVKRLARDLNMEFVVLEGYMRALKRRRLISVTTTRRGTRLVQLPEHRRQQVAAPIAHSKSSAADVA